MVHDDADSFSITAFGEIFKPIVVKRTRNVANLSVRWWIVLIMLPIVYLKFNLDTKSIYWNRTNIELYADAHIREISNMWLIFLNLDRAAAAE